MPLFKINDATENSEEPPTLLVHYHVKIRISIHGSESKEGISPSLIHVALKR